MSDEKDPKSGIDDPFGATGGGEDDAMESLGSDSEDATAGNATGSPGPHEGGGGGVGPAVDDQFEAPRGGEELPTRGVLADIGPADTERDDSAA